jgi:putative addiction module killer protein
MDKIKIINYKTSLKKEPFTEWINSLDITERAIIHTRLNRIRIGNFGDCKSIKNCPGIFEFRINFGPGYRIYYGKIQTTVILLLCGGIKHSQSRDIERARYYWEDYKEATNEKKV